MFSSTDAFHFLFLWRTQFVNISMIHFVVSYVHAQNWPIDGGELCSVPHDRRDLIVTG